MGPRNTKMKPRGKRDVRLTWTGNTMELEADLLLHSQVTLQAGDLEQFLEPERKVPQ